MIPPSLERLAQMDMDWRERLQCWTQPTRARVINRMVNLGRDPDVAADSVDQALYEAVRKQIEFADEDHFGRWLFQCAMRRYTDDWRRTRRLKYGDVPDEAPPSRSGEYRAAELLEECLAMLSDEERRIFERKYLSSDLAVSDEEIAEEFGEAVGSRNRVWRIRKRAEQRIRDCLRGDD